MRIALFAVALSLLAGAAGAQSPDAWPTQPIRMLVPFSAGGMVDTVARATAQHLSERLGKPVVIENRTGANGAIAMEAVARSAPDGHTLVFASNTNFVFLPNSRKSLPYDTLKDLTSVGMVFTAPFYLAVHPSVPVKSVQDLIALAKSQPGKLNYASLGIGGSNHLVMERFKTRAGVDIFHVPYKGSAQAMADLLSGQIQVMFEGSSTIPNIRSGKLRGLASSGASRTHAMPELPTIAESGLPDFDMSTWDGIAAPAGTPRPIINRLNALLGEFLRSPEAAKRFVSLSVELIDSTPEEMDERIRRELPIYGKVMRDAGIQPH
jgi:tripartite-type tricarboxylate transporter receptor subunit TctC